jgi:hypothetical protein
MPNHRLSLAEAKTEGFLRSFTGEKRARRKRVK